MGNDSESGFRTVRGYQMQYQLEGQLTSAMEDYLEMTYRLCLKSDYARVGKLASLLHVKPSSVSKMIAKLAELGYLKYVRYEIIQLTDKGKAVGEILLERHETIERFLSLIGSCDPLMETELIEHSLQPSTIRAVGILLEFFNVNLLTKKNFEEFKRNNEKKGGILGQQERKG